MMVLNVAFNCKIWQSSEPVGFFLGASGPFNGRHQKMRVVFLNEHLQGASLEVDGSKLELCNFSGIFAKRTVPLVKAVHV